MRSHPVLRRFDVYAYVAKAPPSDLSRVPAAVTIRFYQQGATVKTTVTVPDTSGNPDPTPTSVYLLNRGALGQGDQVQVGTNSVRVLSVASMDAATDIAGLLNDTGVDIYIEANDRLVKRTSPPRGDLPDSLGGRVRIERVIAARLSGVGFSLLGTDGGDGAIVNPRLFQVAARPARASRLRA